MNRTLSAASSRALALLLVVALPVILWLGIVTPLVGAVTDRQEEIATLSDRVMRLQAMIARIPDLKRRDHDLQDRLEAEGGIWVAASEAVVSARMEEILRKTVNAGRGVVKSSSQLRGAQEQGFIIVRVRFSIDGTLETLEKTLAAIDDARPSMFVDSFTIVAPATMPPPDRPPVLSLDVEVMGYMRKVDE